MTSRLACEFTYSVPYGAKKAVLQPLYSEESLRRRALPVGRRPDWSLAPVGVAVVCLFTLPHERGRESDRINQTVYHTSSPTARISASALLWRTTPGRMR